MRSHLKEILDSKGIKYSFIAKEASISNSTMTNLIKGGLPTLPVAARIAKVLGKPIEEIWTLDE
ncbi:helix-turn-helix transcriptional regulator [Bacillus thuringiensis]|uniref:Transcriptional regulator n=1 Tax=Bacillus thuringiensis TaxID=1428 RepID=A0A9W3TEE9_BACTU|nr:helix-turn-helix transcriptional regulator [Bacillus thuringiensis]AQY38491.1 transcriptional regulator [Bacillus thuringiensis]MDR4151030.1 helix-turn-helix transcriptional regulator [Bacillus thuringiensis]MEC3572134.1 helix-turn-helix transcriptional regulator [Bacillus thuringiensis]MED2021805.1 helix-turn-helix transcriptional regulator [Bacillus thuringiensis]MED2144724.1 helix-turn-helix transcriptional regulator [Bacillus thuringiensis]